MQGGHYYDLEKRLPGWENFFFFFHPWMNPIRNIPTVLVVLIC